MADLKKQGIQAPAFHRDFLLANSSISKDKTGGKKAEEDDSLRVLSSNTKNLAAMKKRLPSKSSDGSDEPPEKWHSGSSSEDLQQSQTIHNPMQITEPIPWHANTLHRPVKKGKKQKVKIPDESFAGNQNIGSSALVDSNGAEHRETVKGKGREKAPAKVCRMHTRRRYISPTSSVLTHTVMLVQTSPFDH